MTSDFDFEGMTRDPRPPARYIASAELVQLVHLLMELRNTTQSRRSHAQASLLIRAFVCGEPTSEEFYRPADSET